MVVLSDGQDTASGFGFEELIDSVRRVAVPIYTIAPRPTQTITAQRERVFGETTREQDFELRRLAAETGGRAFFPVVLHELAGVYQDIASELAHQYSLGYESSNPQLERGFRRIGLRVTAPGVKWRTRAGYIAHADTAVAGPDLR
jgi:VWFA-related protein